LPKKPEAEQLEPEIYETPEATIKVTRPARKTKNPYKLSYRLINPTNNDNVPFGTRLNPRQQYDPLSEEEN